MIIPFNTKREATIVLNSLEVDALPKKSRSTRSMQVVENSLKM